jgi:exodeoxyribonuclease V alpha subunit
VNSGLKPQSGSSPQEVLAGLVERVTYHNAENGFCVLRVKARGRRELVTTVGHAAVISAGEWVTAAGEWVNDRTHGQQFRARFLRSSAPTSTDGIEKYLASGMIRGIGPVYARKLVKAFGERVFDIIEAEPARLREVSGIGPLRAERIASAWAEQKIVREIMVFLHSHGVGTARAVRIFKTYGADALQVMSENPASVSASSAPAYVPPPRPTRAPEGSSQPPQSGPASRITLQSQRSRILLAGCTT